MENSGICYQHRSRREATENLDPDDNKRHAGSQLLVTRYDSPYVKTKNCDILAAFKNFYQKPAAELAQQWSNL